MKTKGESFSWHKLMLFLHLFYRIRGDC